MTEIIYTISDNFGEISEFSSSSGNRAKIKINGVGKGALHIGDGVYRTEQGEATLDLSRMSDGEYSPYFVGDGRTLMLEGFKRFGRELQPLPTSERLLRRLLARTRSLEDRLELAERKIAEHEDKISLKINF